MAQLMAVMTVISAVSSIAGGISKNNAAKKEAAALGDQARLAEMESADEARIHARQVRKFSANQKSAFLKNGVTLDGSPLAVLEDTRDSGQEEVNSIMRSGAAKAQLIRDKSEITKSEGRSALIGGFSSAASSASSSYLGAKGAGLFGGTATAGVK